MGTKGLQCAASAETCTFPRERAQVTGRRGYLAGRARCLQHPSTGWKVGQGLFAKLLGLIKGQNFVSAKNAEMLPSRLPHLEGQGL